MNVVHLRSCDLRALIAALDRLLTPVSPANFPAHFFALMTEMLPDSLVSVDFADLAASGRVESHISVEASEAANRPLAELEGAVAATLWQHPAMHHLAQVDPTAVVRPTDFVSLRQFRATAFWQECHRPLRLYHQVVAGMAWSGHVGGFTVNRCGAHDFNDREVELIRRVRPHVQAAFAHSLLLAGTQARLDANRRTETGATGATDFPPKRLVAYGLTLREAETLRWLTEGKRDSEIAAILGVGTRTIHTHVGRILTKLGVETRTAAAATAYRWLVEG